jgi:hypothetical protein
MFIGCSQSRILDISNAKNAFIHDPELQNVAANKREASIWTHKDPVKGDRSYNIRTATLGAVAIASVNIILLVMFGSNNFFAAIAGMAIVTFIGVLSLADYVSIEPSMSTGEMRSAMAASITVVYLAIQALTVAGEIQVSEASSKILESFSVVMAAVVGFYFGSKAAIQLAEIIMGKKKENNQG